jgi:hypothetical protein
MPDMDWYRKLLLFGSTVIEVDGAQVVFDYHSRSKNSPAWLQLSLRGGFSAQAVFRRETAMDKAGKELGINQEIQLYDDRTDSTLYIECEDRDFVARLLGDAETRQVMLDLLNSFTAVKIDRGLCLLEKRPCAVRPDPNSDEARIWARLLVFLAQKIPPPLPGHGTATPLTRAVRQKEGLFTNAGAVAAVAGLALTIWGTASFQPLETGRVFFFSLMFGLGVFVVFFILAAVNLCGHASSFSAIIRAGFLGLMGCILSGWGGLMVVNGGLDPSTPLFIETRVAGKSVTSTRSGARYNLYLFSDDRRVAGYKYRVPAGVYQRIHENDRCVLTTKQGALGFMWLLGGECPPAREDAGP